MAIIRLTVSSLRLSTHTGLSKGQDRVWGVGLGTKYRCMATSRFLKT